MKLELDDNEIQLVWAALNQVQFPGQMAELVVSLKQKVKDEAMRINKEMMEKAKKDEAGKKVVEKPKTQ